MLAIRHEILWVGVWVEPTENRFVATASSFRERQPRVYREFKDHNLGSNIGIGSD